MQEVQQRIGENNASGNQEQNAKEPAVNKVGNPGSEQVRLYFLETEQYHTQIKTLREQLEKKAG